MLTSLTPQEESYLDAQITLWAGIRSDTRPLCLTTAKEAIELAYDCAGQPPPTNFVWLKSPMALKICASQILNKSLYDTVYNLIDGGVDGAIHKAAGYEIRKRVYGSIGEQKFGLVEDIALEVFHNKTFNEEFWTGLSDSLWEADLGEVWDELDISNSFGSTYCHGSMTPWLGAYEFLLDVCGLTSDLAMLEGLIDTAHECGWWVPFENVALVSSKPLIIRSSFFQWEDGFAVHL